MAVSLQPTSSKTTIFDLNDDCLKEVFAHMDPETLTTAADVCTRFKQNTMHAARRTQIKEIQIIGKELNLRTKPSVYRFSTLRNFGGFIEKIHLVGRDVEYRSIQYLSLYCVGKSVELRCSFSNITDEISILMRPLIGRVQKLRFDSFSRLGRVFLQNLPLWSAQQQESEYGASKPINDHEKQFDHLRQKNLKSIFLNGVHNVTNVHIEELLQQNPQLKEIGLVACNSLDNSVLESITRNGSAIEKIAFVMMWDRHAPRNFVYNRDHFKYFFQLHELRSLTLAVNFDDSYVQSVIHEIASVNTCLDHLDLRELDFRHNPNQFIGEISKLQKLKTLRMSRVDNFTAAHLIEICKHAKELSVINFGFFDTMMITNGDLLQIVENARKLQEFEWVNESRNDAIRTNIDGNTFLKLARMVDQRHEKTNLSIYLTRGLFTLTIPANLLTVVNNLKIKLTPRYGNDRD